MECVSFQSRNHDNIKFLVVLTQIDESDTDRKMKLETQNRKCNLILEHIELPELRNHALRDCHQFPFSQQETNVNKYNWPSCHKWQSHEKKTKIYESATYKNRITKIRSVQPMLTTCLPDFQNR